MKWNLLSSCPTQGRVVVVDLGFTTLLTSQIISVAFYSEREKSDKFCSEALISAWGSFTCRKSTIGDPWLYFPSEGSHTKDFYAVKKSSTPAGFEPANLVSSEHRVESKDEMRWSPYVLRPVNSKDTGRPTDRPSATVVENMKWNEMDEISVEKWWNEIFGKGIREKPREKPIQTPFRPPRNPYGVIEAWTRDPSVGRRAFNRLGHGAAPQFRRLVEMGIARKWFANFFEHKIHFSLLWQIL